MLRSHRNVIFAIVGLLVGVLGLGSFIGWTLWPGTSSLPDYGWQETAYTDYEPGGRSCQPPAINRLATKAERLRKSEACEDAAEQHRIQTNDLKQQTRAADAAAAAVVVAEWQAKATVFGLIVGFYTLAAATFAAFFAKQAADETKRGADAALDSIQTNRAWVFPKDVLYPQITNCNVDGVHVNSTLGFMVSWLNTGTTPATSVAVAIRIAAFPKDFDEQAAITHFKIDAPPAHELVGLIAPGQSMTSEMRVLPEAECVMFRNGAKYVALYTTANYTDVYGKSHVTYAQYLVRHQGGNIVDQNGARESIRCTLRHSTAT